PAEMSTLELKRHIEQLRALHFDPIKEEVEMYAKLALPFATFPIMVLGVPIILIACKRGIAAGLGACVCIVLVMFLSTLATLPLGRSGAISPFHSAFLPPFAACIIGFILFLRIRR
ncbi:MAG: LptF/LptG family permease, partial [bacterium]